MGQEKERETGELIAFHGAILVLGSFLVMPLALSLFAQALGGDIGQALSRLSYSELVGFSLVTLVPSSAAFGTEFRFSIFRFIFVAAFVALTVYGQGVKSLPQVGHNLVLVPLGGGLLGIGLAWLLGSFGLHIRERMRLSRAWRLAVYGLLATGVLASGGAYIEYRKEQEELERERRRLVEKQRQMELKRYEEMKREERKHLEEIEREERKHLEEIERKRREYEKDMRR